MKTIAILPETIEGNGTQYRAVGNGIQTVGSSAGAALDALTARLDPTESGTLVVIQTFAPDRYFSAEQRRRLDELMAQWRMARDSGQTLPPEQQRELELLTRTELDAALQRTQALRRELTE